MVKRELIYCEPAKKDMELYRDTINLGMAPGGIVKAWVGKACLGYKEIGRFQAEVDPRGPHKNNNHEYYRPPNPEAQAYIDENGIPYGTW